MIMKKVALFCLALAIANGIQAQEVYNSSGSKTKTAFKPGPDKKGFDASKLIFGGGLGLAFGSVTSISIAPSVGYRITDNFGAGIVLGYNYLRVKDYGTVRNLITNQQKNIHLTQSIYTGGVWARYNIIANLFGHAQFEFNNFVFRDYFGTGGYKYDDDGWPIFPKQQIAIPSLLLGLGYRQPIEGLGSFFVMASYDVLQRIPSNMRVDNQGNKYSLSPYANTIDFRAGFFVGF